MSGYITGIVPDGNFIENKAGLIAFDKRKINA